MHRLNLEKEEVKMSTSSTPTPLPSSASPEMQALHKAVANEISVDQSAMKAFSGLSEQLKKTANSAGPDGHVDASELQAMAKELDASAAALSAAITQNTPAATLSKAAVTPPTTQPPPKR
jgi:hypothetical protein